MALSPDGKLLATGGSEEGTAKIWEVATGKEVRSVTVGGASVYSINFDANGKNVITSGADNSLKAINIETGEVKSIDDTIGYLHQFEFSRDGRFMAAAARGGIVVWDAKTWKEHKFIECPSAYVTFSNDGAFIASTGSDGKVHMLEVKTGKEVALLGDGTARQSRPRFSADGRRLMVSGNDGNIRVFGPRSAGMAAPIRPPAPAVPEPPIIEFEDD